MGFGAVDLSQSCCNTPSGLWYCQGAHGGSIVRPMYTRITTSDGRSYLQLVEGHRDAEGKVRIKVVANLGRLDRLTPGKLAPLINGLNRAVGRLENTADAITHEPARAYGDVFALHALWKDLGFDRALGRAVRSGKRKLDVEALVRAMVFNRLCDPTSKLGCLRWLDTVAMAAFKCRSHRPERGGPRVAIPGPSALATMERISPP